MRKKVNDLELGRYVPAVGSFAEEMARRRKAEVPAPCENRPDGRRMGVNLQKLSVHPGGLFPHVICDMIQQWIVRSDKSGVVIHPFS